MKKKLQPLLNVYRGPFTALVENKATGMHYEIKDDPEHFERMALDAPVEVWECTKIRFMPEKQKQVRFTYKKHLYLRVFLELIKVHCVVEKSDGYGHTSYVAV